LSKTKSKALRNEAGFEVFCGIDVARETHHAVALNRDGDRLVDRPLPNAEPDLVKLFDQLRDRGRVLVVVDQLASIGALAIAVARARDIAVAYLPGLSMRRIADLYPGEGKTDARDAHIIADAARTLPHALRRVGPDEQTTVELAVLAGYDADLAAESTRLINRLHDALLHVHPTLERLLGKHFHCPGVLRLLAATGTPAAIGGDRRARDHRTDNRWVSTVGTHSAGTDPHRAGRPERDDPGHPAVRPGHPRAGRPAADRPGPTRHPARRTRGAPCGPPPRGDHHLDARCRPPHRDRAAAHRRRWIGLPLRSAHRLLRRTGAGDPTVRAQHQGRAPTPPREPGTEGALYLSAFASLRHPPSRSYYDRKRAEGKSHTAALTCLARRRVDVLHAMLRDRQPYQPDHLDPTAPPTANKPAAA